MQNLRKKQQINLFYFCRVSLFILIFFSSCSAFYSKEDYIKDFTAFVETVEKDYSTFKEEDWKNSDLDYQKYTNEDFLKFRDKLSEDDKYIIGKLKGRYETLKLKVELKKVYDNAKDAVDQASGVIDGVIESINKK